MPSTETWTMVGAWGAVLGVLGLLFKNIGPWRKQISDMETTLRTEMHDQIEKLHVQLSTERAEHIAELKAYEMQREEMSASLSRVEQALVRQQIRHNAERSLDRHRLNNINQCFDALLMLLKAKPEDSTGAVKMIEEMRAKQVLAESEEKAIIRAAEITANDCETDHDGN